MKILAITSRDYYDLIDSIYWEKKECAEVANYIAQLYQEESDNNKFSRKFFLKETQSEKCIPFWNKHRNEPFNVLIRQIKEEACIYVIPCIPREHNNQGQLCEHLRTRQNFIGTFLKFVRKEALSRTKEIDKFLLVCHEADIFSSDEERAFQKTDISEGSILNECIDLQFLEITSIYGYQHDNKAGSLYSIFNGNLGKEDLSIAIIDEICERIKKSTILQNNQQLTPIVSPISATQIVKTIVCGKTTKISVSYSSTGENNLAWEDSDTLCSQLKSAIEKFYEDERAELPQSNYQYKIALHKKNYLESESLQHHQYDFCQNSFLNECVQLPLIHFCNCSLDEITKYYRYASIMDNSIWNFYVKISIDCYNNVIFEDDDRTRYIKILEIIANNYKEHLYDLAIAKEFVDLNARITCNSYIKSIGGHGDYIAPFVFHSENWMKGLINDEFINNDKIKKICSKKWRILLVDDKSETKLSPFTNKEDVAGRLDNKLKIIESRLNDFFKDAAHIDNFVISTQKFKDKEDIVVGERLSNNSRLVIEYVEKLEDAEKAMKVRKYDIVLLDYLLDEYKEGHHYGYDLLNDIFDDIKYSDERKEIVEGFHEYNFGPDNRFFFMFISAYSSAVHDRLLAEGLNLSEDYWHISLGGCPTNTPQLFLYHLLKQMEKRLEDSGILKLSSNEIYKIIDKIFSQKEQDTIGDSVRKKANALYQKVLSLQYHYRSILRDVEIPFGQKTSVFNTNGSVLMTDFIQTKINLGGMLEHLTQLIHLTAFGTVRQWPEMWEEYIYFKAQFEKQLDGNPDEMEKLRNLWKNIEAYILELKSQQQ